MSIRDDLGTIWPGTTWTGVFTLTDDEGEPEDVSAWDAELRIGDMRGANLLTVTHASAITRGEDGTFTIELSPDRSMLLSGYGTVLVDLDAGPDDQPIARGILAVGDRVRDAS